MMNTPWINLKHVRPKTGRFRFTLYMLILVLSSYPVFAQQTITTKYGGDFLSQGVGARASSLGNSFTSLANDVTASYWNPSGLEFVNSIQGSYMHAEQFGGIVAFDYAGFALPLKQNGTIALSFMRQGVDNIKNTLNIYNEVNGQPDLTNISTFSTSDLAFLISYSNTFRDTWRWGLTTKMVSSKLGPFADAWGYSLDLGISKNIQQGAVALVLQDVTTLNKYWNVNDAYFSDYSALFENGIPLGQHERTLPSIRLGGHKTYTINDLQLTGVIDLTTQFENKQAFYLNVGPVSFEPALGVEFNYLNKLYFRSGLNNFTTDTLSSKLYAHPNVGLGVKLGMFDIDYAFTRSSLQLGNTHRVSVLFILNRK